LGIDKDKRLVYGCHCLVVQLVDRIDIGSGLGSRALRVDCRRS
jgi:hypothetical protein